MFKKILLVFVLLYLHFTACYAQQDTSWTVVKADRVFSVSMPRNFIKTDTTFSTTAEQTKIIKLSLWGGDFILQILKIPTHETGKEKEIIFSDLERDLREQGRALGFTPIFLDTVVGHLKGLQGLLYLEDEVKKRGYFFVAEGKLYSFYYSKNESAANDHYEDFKRLLGSVNFSSPEAIDSSDVPLAVTEYIPQPYEKDWTGELIICSVLLVMIVGIVLYIKYKA